MLEGVSAFWEGLDDDRKQQQGKIIELKEEKEI